MACWRNMRQSGAGQYSAQMKERMWAIYGFPFGKNLIMNNRVFRYIPVCPSYGERLEGEQDVEAMDQNSVLLNIPTGGNEKMDSDVTNV